MLMVLSLKEMNRFAFFGLIAMIGVAIPSCSRYALMDKVPVEFKEPGKTVYVECDTSFCLGAPDILGPNRLQIVADSILVIVKQPEAASPYFFSAYSTRTFCFLGSFLAEGRGPGEALRPDLAPVSSSSQVIYARDNSLGVSWEFDAMASIQARTGVSLRSVSLPGDLLGWLPLTDTLRYSTDLRRGEFLYGIFTATGEEYKSFSPFPGLNTGQYITLLSDIATSSGTNGKVAFPMVFFPLIHMLDAESGQWRAIAADKGWRKWKSLLLEAITPENFMEKRQYYMGATSSADYFFAAYSGCCLKDLQKGGNGTEIRVFDWDGNYACRILVKEDIDNMTYDSQAGYLYCIDRPTGRIVRYDLTSIFLPV